MKEINSFTFFKNYWDVIKELPNKEELSIAILEYVFEDKKPEFNNLNLAIWNLIKVGLDVSKNKANNAKKGDKSNQNQIKIKSKSNKNQKEIKSKTKNEFCSISISSSISYSFNNNYINNNKLLKDKLIEWINYKKERKEEYKEIGFKSLLTQIENNCKKYGDDAVIDLITESMANNWKGIVWEKLKNTKKMEETKKYSEEWWNKL